MKIRMQHGFVDSTGVHQKEPVREIEVADDFFTRLTGIIGAPRDATLFVGPAFFDAFQTELKKVRR
jgi:hypothetical protein